MIFLAPLIGLWLAFSAGLRGGEPVRGGRVPAPVVADTGRVLVGGDSNWNEFGEGHYLMPTRGFGFGHLEAVRQVFAPASPVPDRILPQDLGLGPYDSHFRAVSGTQTP